MGASMLSRRTSEMIADTLGAYTGAHSTLLIIHGESVKRYKEEMKKMEKAIDKMRKGKCNSKLYKMENLELFADSLEAQAMKMHG